MVKPTTAFWLFGRKEVMSELEGCGNSPLPVKNSGSV